MFTKIFSFFLLVMGIYLTVNAQEKLTLFEPIDLQRDVGSLVSYLEETHPNPYFTYSKEKFYEDISKVKQRIDKPLNVIEFYLLLEPIIVKLKDGHTDLELPISEFNKINPNPFRLPLKLKFSTKKPFIINQDAYEESTSSKIPTGAEICSINGISADKIVSDIIAMTAGESNEFRLAYGSSFFTFFLKELYNIDKVYDINYSSNGQQSSVNLRGIRETELTKLEKGKSQTTSASASAGPYQLHIMDSLSTAIIDFRSFKDKSAFNLFADSAFSLLKEKGIKNLIIDIRYNLGGDSDIGDDFLQYFIDSDFTQYSKLVKKYSRLQKERYRNNENTCVGDSAYIEMMNKPNGSMEIEFSPMVKKRNTPTSFVGNLFVLTSPFTFSSAADFAQAVKHYNLGKIVGEETGGMIVSFGDIVYAELPNSQIPFTISRCLYYNIGAGDTDFRGVKVDFNVDYRKALNYTLDMIGNNPSSANSKRH
jgi:hypothetical protein